MGLSYDVMLRRADTAPDEKRILLIDPTLEEALMAALQKYLQQGAVLTKDAALKGRNSLQYKPGSGGQQPGATQPFIPFATMDINQNNVTRTPGAYIVLLSCETAGVRYTTSGIPPTSTFGTLVPKNTFVYITLQDWSNLYLCATASGEIIDLELYEVDA